MAIAAGSHLARAGACALGGTLIQEMKHETHTHHNIRIKGHISYLLRGWWEWMGSCNCKVLVVSSIIIHNNYYLPTNTYFIYIHIMRQWIDLLLFRGGGEKEVEFGEEFESEIILLSLVLYHLLIWLLIATLTPPQQLLHLNYYLFPLYPLVSVNINAISTCRIEESK